MAEVPIPPDNPLAIQIEQLRSRRWGEDALLLEDVLSAVEAVVSRHSSIADAALLREIAGLGHAIAATRAEIAALHVHDISGMHIPSATDELDAIIAHTATATDTILESCEALDAVAETLDCGTANSLRSATTRIYEACSFQDITGQRIKKVVLTLKMIESKVMAITTRLSSWPVPVAAVQSDVGLLNGPQLPEIAMSQSSIDHLLDGVRS